MMCNVMPREDFRFIEKIQMYMLDSTNMTKDEAWSFAFSIWQSKGWLTKYLLDDARNDIAYEQGKAEAIEEYTDKAIECALWYLWAAHIEVDQRDMARYIRKMIDFEPGGNNEESLKENNNG